MQLRVKYFCNLTDWMLEAAPVRTEPSFNYTLGCLTGFTLYEYNTVSWVSYSETLYQRQRLNSVE